jgi:DNA helicase-2/ATP-dependent DNA helicase PcrA
MIEKTPQINYEEIEIFSRLNKSQKKAVFHDEGPLLVLAGAGTGKTGVLTSRLIRLLIERKALPGELLSVTFTNKAANEMRERVNKQIGDLSSGLRWLGTFHSIGAKILRYHPEKIELKNNFIILDTDDQIRLLKQIIIDENINEKRWPPKMLLNLIDQWKNKGLYPNQISPGEKDYFANGKGKKLYALYQERLKFFNAADFGDLILEVIRLFEENTDILESYQKRFKFTLVDEYQDTNTAQYKLLKLISDKSKNICCVGDDDQSIYSWRGAEVSNILRFEKDFKDSKIIRLEENYRSSGHILGAASKLIEKNSSRLGKTLWTSSGDGEKVLVTSVWDGEEEARLISTELESIMQKNRDLNEAAVLVRASFQMREFEDRFISIGLPYKVIGGPRFYERKEIRDCNAYLRLALLPTDSLALQRVINTPKRGIGETSVKKIRDYSKKNNIPMIEASNDLITNSTFKGKTKESLSQLINLIYRWHDQVDKHDNNELAEMIIEDSGYLEMLRRDESLTSTGRVENIYELFKSLEPFESIQAYLEHISLVMEIDRDQDGQKVSLMTLHAAKGLEFDYIFLPGWEEGVFPNQRAIDEGGQDSLEEERRLAYVGITRAKKKCSIFFSANRRMHNQWISSIPSRFVNELPENNTELNMSHFSGERELFKKNDFSDFDQSDYETPGWERGKNFTDTQSLEYKNTKFIENSNNSSFHMGSKVTHKKFGEGEVLSVDGKKLTINFGKGGTRKVMENFVEEL